MWLFILGCIVAFIIGAGGTLLIAYCLYRFHEKALLKSSSLGAGFAFVVVILYVLLLSLIVGLVCTGLFVLYHFLSSAGRLYLIGAVIAILGITLLVWGSRRVASQQEEQQTTRREEKADQQEKRFLNDYARFFQAASDGNIAEAKILLGLGMPYTRKELLANHAAHYLPAVGELTLALHRQDLGSTAPIYLTQTPLEAAAQAGHTEMVRLLLEWQRFDEGTVDVLKRAIIAAENSGHPEITNLITMNESLSPTV